ncbi:class I SAM-dependent methyltransferase [Roseicella frigidaeris]|uniref:Methyltransferase type 11 domain-containing protein n=1 Tax=Roseicella frigidaeris TaxID=2230885 RepID=A0A327LYD4_9PROT|nr:class I SAM-dependent methyltransferase [Roseicella frigidaeris]RAI55921.1 hypothetical protein DOO78_23525 [Roseicella frigidaeris]
MSEVAMPPTSLDALLDQVSDGVWEEGLRVLQGTKLAPTEAEHVSILLRLMAPPLGSVILDAGCGFGEVARLMRAERPDLAFVLLNRNGTQLRRAPRGSGFTSIQADMGAVPLADGSVGGAMFLYALCHVDPLAALSEAARVVRPGGFCFIFDFVRTGGDNALMERHLHARAHSAGDFMAACEAAGWHDVRAAPAPGDDGTFRALFADQALFDAIFAEVRPVLWRLTK